MIRSIKEFEMKKNICEKKTRYGKCLGMSLVPFSTVVVMMDAFECGKVIHSCSPHLNNICFV